ncbi:elongator complex protein 5 [Phalacrocorax carbo]|uniref:elongator complex protein 5 n=1 Tax=Phalacrocorax carbo TaxID=9209 RepID=UPI003119B6A5
MLEALVAGGAEGLVLVQDSAACEGRSLLRAFVTAAVQRAERVLVVLFDVPREQFEAGLSSAVKERLLYRDGFTDPLGWSGPAPDLRAGDFGGLLAGGLPAGGPLTVVLDSLSWLLLRLPPPRLCQALGALLGGPPNSGPIPRLVALLHGDLHPPGLLRALGALASTRLTLGGPPPAPGAPRLASVLSRPRRGGPRQKDESFTLLPDGSLGVPPPAPREGGPGGSSPPAAQMLGSPAGSGGCAPPPPPHLPLVAVGGRAGGAGGRAPPRTSSAPPGGRPSSRRRGPLSAPRSPLRTRTPRTPTTTWTCDPPSPGYRRTYTNTGGSRRTYANNKAAASPPNLHPASLSYTDPAPSTMQSTPSATTTPLQRAGPAPRAGAPAAPRRPGAAPAPRKWLCRK